MFLELKHLLPRTTRDACNRRVACAQTPLFLVETFVTPKYIKWYVFLYYISYSFNKNFVFFLNTGDPKGWK